MRLDAARLKECSVAASARSCYQKSKVFHHQGLPNNPPLGGFFRFWRSLYRPVDPGSSPLILKTWNFFALKPFSGQIAPFSRSKKPPRRPSRRGGSSRGNRGFGGRSTPEQGHRAPRTRSGKGSLCSLATVHHSTMGGILQALDLDL